MADKTDVLSVTQACKLAQGHIKQLPSIVIEGEVSGYRFYKRAKYSSAYFDIKDEHSKLLVVAWEDVIERSGIEIHDGMKLRMKGAFDLYANNGSFQFKPYAIYEAGLGDLREQIKRLAKKLREEGLLDDARKHPPVAFCEHIVVCTSLNGVVKDDVARTLRRRNPLVRIDVVNCAVQGAQAPATIVRALKIADRQGADAIVLARGGGSLEELMCFNDESVARAIVACKTPVVTGIGHEDDVTIADMVADLRASTPTAAAEAVAPDTSKLIEALMERRRRLYECWKRFSNEAHTTLDAHSQALRHTLELEISQEAHAQELNSSKLSQVMQNYLEAHQHKLAMLAAKPCFESPYASIREQEFQLAQTAQRLDLAATQGLKSYKTFVQGFDKQLDKLELTRLAQMRDQLTHQERDIERSMQTTFQMNNSKLAQAAATLDALSPLKVLSRGYAITFDTSGHVIKDATQVSAGDKISVRLGSGTAHATVDAVDSQ